MATQRWLQHHIMSRKEPTYEGFAAPLRELLDGLDQPLPGRSVLQRRHQEHIIIALQSEFALDVRHQAGVF